MKRRVFGHLMALGLGVLGSFGAGGEGLVLRRGRFIEFPEHVRGEFSLTPLLASTDLAAQRSLDSGFSLRFLVRVELYAWGHDEVLGRLKRELHLHFDPWTKSYRVQWRDNGGDWQAREFQRREGAVQFTLRLKADFATTGLSRGRKSPYYLVVHALRNPRVSTQALDPSGRDTSRDLSLFGRWVGLFAREPAAAEKEMHFRSNYFFLPEEEPG